MNQVYRPLPSLRGSCHRRIKNVLEQPDAAIPSVPGQAFVQKPTRQAMQLSLLLAMTALLLVTCDLYGKGPKQYDEVRFLRRLLETCRFRQNRGAEQ